MNRSLSKYILEVHLHHTYKTFLCYSYRLCRSRTRLWDQSAASVKVKGKNRQLGEQNSSPPHLKYFVWVKLTLHSCVVFWPSGVYFCRSVLLVYVLFTKSGKVCFCMVLKPQERKCLLCLSDKKGQSFLEIHGTCLFVHCVLLMSIVSNNVLRDQGLSICSPY